MIRYLILCPADTQWALLPKTFDNKLKERWPDAEVKPETLVPGIAFTWSVPDEEVDLYGTFHRDGLTVGLEGFLEGYAVFACWYRTVVPPEVPLIMMDEGYNVVYPLAPGTTPEDILSKRIALRPPPDPEDLFPRTRKR